MFYHLLGERVFCNEISFVILESTMFIVAKWPAFPARFYIIFMRHAREIKLLAVRD